jgi:hypothetical protein
MGFIGIYRAIYDYTPSGEGELAISDGDLLFIQDKGEDDWWKAKKKAASEDDEEPEGLIPANYVEEVRFNISLPRRVFLRPACLKKAMRSTSALV